MYDYVNNNELWIMNYRWFALCVWRFLFSIT